MACEHEIIADRIEAGTYMIAAAITGGEILVSGCVPEHLGALICEDAAGGSRCDRRRRDGAAGAVDGQLRADRYHDGGISRIRRPICRRSTWR